MGHHRTLYGKDGRSGIATDLNQKADKACLAKYLKKPPIVLVIAIFTVIIVPTVVTGVKVWSGQEVSAHIYAKKDTVHQHQERIIALEEKVKAIHNDISKLDRSVRDQKEEMTKQFDEMKDLIHRLFRKRGNSP